MKMKSIYKRAAALCLCLGLFTACIFADIEKWQSNFALQLIESSGSFSLRCNGETGKSVSLFSANDNFSSTFFAVKIGNTVYRLSRDSGVPCIVEETENGDRLTYTIARKAEVTVDFSFCPEFDGVTQSVVKVDVTVANISSEIQSVALKAVFDTVLGENAEAHFSTARRPAINAELYTDSVSSDKWIRSANDTEAVQFLLNGTGITVPMSVTLANKDVLNGSLWNPSSKPGRSFNSVFSYNNSAVGIFWNPISIPALTRSSVRFYISMAAAGNLPPDAQFLNNAAGSVSHLNENDEIVYKDEHGTMYTVGTVTDEQLDPKYIEDLLLRIRRLEANPESVEHIDIVRLNAELDAILEKIRRQQ